MEVKAKRGKRKKLDWQPVRHLQTVGNAADPQARIDEKGPKCKSAVLAALGMYRTK